MADRTDELYGGRAPLRGKAAVVTGASRGIGREIALALAQSGADVVINGTSAALLAGLEAEIRALGRGCAAVCGGIQRPETAGELADACMRRFGRIDILVNNAGINRRTPFLELEAESWREILAVNLDGVFYACKSVLPHMVAAGRGAVVNISSSAAKTPHANAAAAYGASKGAVNALTRQLARDMAPHGIRVNAVCPGPIETDMSAQWTEDYRREVLRRVPLGRLGTPRDVAGAVLFLAGDGAAFITGETLNLNGGAYMD